MRSQVDVHEPEINMGVYNHRVIGAIVPNGDISSQPDFVQVEYVSVDRLPDSQGRNGEKIFLVGIVVGKGCEARL